MVSNDYRYYSPEEIFQLFKEEHRLCSPLDPMADESFELEKDTLVVDWQDARDLLPWQELAQYLNYQFKTTIPIEEWKSVLAPKVEKTMWDICLLLSQHAQKEIVKPIFRLGTECLSAGIFLTLKRNLKAKGVDVSGLKPSTPIEPFLEKHFSEMIEEVTAMGVRTFEKIEYGKLTTARRYETWLDWILAKVLFKRPLKTGNIQTFRDLVEKVMEREPLE